MTTVERDEFDILDLDDVVYESDEEEEPIVPKYDFMIDGTLVISRWYRGRPDEIHTLLEEINSEEALDYITKIIIDMLVICEFDDVFDALIKFLNTSSKVTWLKLELFEPSDMDFSYDTICIVDVINACKYVSNIELKIHQGAFFPDAIDKLATVIGESTIIRKIRIDANYNIIKNVAASIASNDMIEYVAIEIPCYSYKIKDVTDSDVMDILTKFANSKIKRFHFCIYLLIDDEIYKTVLETLQNLFSSNVALLVFNVKFRYCINYRDNNFVIDLPKIKSTEHSENYAQCVSKVKRAQ